MGLDIVAYSEVRFGPEMEAMTDILPGVEEQDLWVNHEFRDHAPDFPTDENGDVKVFFTEGTKTMSFRAGSYSTYSSFRKTLCKVLYDIDDPLVIWTEPELWKDKPFYYLINFSDCEGIISSSICKILLNDFLTLKQDEDKWLQLQQWEQGICNDFIEALEIASTDGFIVYT